MKGNVVAFPKNPDKIAEILPILPDSVNIQVILIGPRRPSLSDILFYK
jgi:hypothetical protein